MTIDELLTHSKKTYIAKIGNTFLVSPMSEESVETMSTQEVDKCFREFPDEMIKCLKNTPNVVNYSPDMDSELMGSFYIKEEKNGEPPIKVYEVSGLAPDFFDYINFQVIWPSKNQEVPSWYSGQVVESFNIIYDGVLFLTFGESTSIGDTSYAWQFGLEAMKIIRTCFEKSNLWEVTKIGPIMLHPAIYFVFLDDKVELTLPTTRVRNNDLYIFFRYQNVSASEQAILDFFDSVKYEMKEHYGNLVLRKEIMDTEMEFRKKFLALGSAHQKLLSSSSWSPASIKKRYGYTKQLRDNIREAYQVYVDLMDLQAFIIQERNSNQTRLLQNNFLKEIAYYFEEELSDVGKTDFSPILQGLRFFEEETRMVMTGRSNLQAALIGAIVASAIYAIAWVLLG